MAQMLDLRNSLELVKNDFDNGSLSDLPLSYPELTLN